jgi:hypothetical protein
MSSSETIDELDELLLEPCDRDGWTKLAHHIAWMIEHVYEIEPRARDRPCRSFLRRITHTPKREL